MSDVLSWIRLPGPFLIGHRGYARFAPENTPAAFEAALEAGCDGVELDVRLTADGVPIVHHDAEGREGEGRLELEGMRAADLAGLVLQDRSGRRYTVPTLGDVLAGLSRRALVNVEVKPPLQGRHDAVAAAVLEALEKARPASRCWSRRSIRGSWRRSGPGMRR